MKKALYFLVAIFIILFTKTTFWQEGNSMLQSEIGQEYTPYHANTIPVGFVLGDTVLDVTDDNLNDSEKKSSNIQNIVFSTSYLAAHSVSGHFCKSKWAPQPDPTFPSTLYLLNSVFII